MLIAEELLLLAHDDLRTGPSPFDDLPYCLAGAVLVDLVLAGRVTLGEGPGRSLPADREVVVLDRAPTGRDGQERVLDHLLALAASRPRRAGELVEVLARQAERPLLDGLVARGLLRREDRTTWGVLRSTRWRAADGPAVAALRRRVQRVLLDGAAPDDGTAALLVLADGCGWLRPRVPRDRRRDVEARTREIVEAWGRGTPTLQVAGAVTAAALSVVSAAALVIPVAAT